MTLTNKETNAILAGLRLLQDHPNLLDLVQHGEPGTGLSIRQIDALCEKINTVEDEPRIAAFVDGGILQGAISNVPELKLTVIDRDTEDEAEKLANKKAERLLRRELKHSTY